MYGVPYQQHSEPSRAAAATIKPKTMERRVYDVIKNAGPNGRTDEEIYRTFLVDLSEGYVKESTLRARRVRLVDLGQVKPATDECGTCYVTRPTESGRKAQVWVAV